MSTSPIPIIPPNLLPISKSRAIRLLFLGLRDNTDVVIRKIEAEHNGNTLPDDVLRMLDACRTWENNQYIPVGESATVLRFLWWINQVQKTKKQFLRAGTLIDRQITLRPEMLSWSIYDLLDITKILEGTSQLASAATLSFPDRYPRVSTNCPHHLQITYRILDEWASCRSGGTIPIVGIDPTIQTQAQAYMRVIAGDGQWHFEMAQQEDFPFTYIMLGNWALGEAKKRWPSLAKHESNRFIEVESAKSEWLTMNTISSTDHRVIQAIAMFAILKGYKPRAVRMKIEHPSAVDKSWPTFYQFIDWAYSQRKV